MLTTLKSMQKRKFLIGFRMKFRLLLGLETKPRSLSISNSELSTNHVAALAPAATADR